MVIVLTDSPLTNEQWDIVDESSEKFSRPSSDFSPTYNFWEATNGLGTLKTDDLNTTLGIPDYTSTEKVGIYPNPTDDYIQLRGLENSESYTISNLVGKNIVTGNIDNNEKIDVKHLKSGIYFISTETGTRMKFIKQ